MTRILVTGASGLLGLNFCLQFFHQHALTGVVNHHLLRDAPFVTLQADLSAENVIDELLEQSQPEVVLHCAALANLDACERQPKLAWQVNTRTPEELARRAARDGFKLVHISTDAVFDGERGGYSEGDRPNPLGVYARSKLAAEEGVLAACPEALVARVNFYGWSLSGQRSLAEHFYKNLAAGRPCMGFTDVFFCPLEVTQLGETLLRLIELDSRGVYHVLSRDCLSKFEFGREIARVFGFDESLIWPVKVAESGLTARRSPNLTMRTEKLAQALGHEAPAVAEGLLRFQRQAQVNLAQQIKAMAAERIQGVE